MGIRTLAAAISASAFLCAGCDRVVRVHGTVADDKSCEISVATDGRPNPPKTVNGEFKLTYIGNTTDVVVSCADLELIRLRSKEARIELGRVGKPVISN